MGLPAAVSAKLAHPERTVVCLAGDGCFQMSMQEFGTAVQYGANIIVIVVNNGVYGTIRMHQQKTYPDRPSGTDIRNPDFAALAAHMEGLAQRSPRRNNFPMRLLRPLLRKPPRYWMCKRIRAPSPRAAQTLPNVIAAMRGLTQNCSFQSDCLT